MDYTVEVTLRTQRALTEDALVDVAGLGGVAVGKPGGHYLETTLSVRADDVRRAADLAIAQIAEQIAGTVVAVEVMTTAEADRRSAERPKLVGVKEIAELLGISKQRVSTLSKREDFPKPLESLASGPIWRAGDLTTFAEGWRRKPGRPRKEESE